MSQGVAPGSPRLQVNPLTIEQDKIFCVFLYLLPLSRCQKIFAGEKKNHSNFDKSVFFKENSFLIGTIEPWLSPRATVALLISVATSRERTSWLEEPDVHPFFIGFQDLPLIQKVEMSH